MRPAFASLSRRVEQVAWGALRLVEDAGAPEGAAFGDLAFAHASPGPVLELFAGFPFGMDPRELDLWIASPQGRALWTDGFAARGLLAFPCRVLASPGVLPAAAAGDDLGARMGRGIVGLVSLPHRGFPDPGGSRDGPHAARTLCPAFGTLLDLTLPPGNLSPDSLDWLARACDLELAASIELGGPSSPGVPCAGASPPPLPAAVLAARAGATAAALRERVPAPALAAYAAARRAYWRGSAPPGPPTA